jgi:hypothetical protein
MSRKLLLSVLLLCCFQRLWCQHYLGIAPGNLAGTHGVYLNPSSVADTRQGFYLNLFSLDTYFSNNYARYKSEIKPFDLLSIISKGTIGFNETEFELNNDGRSKNLLMGTELRGPALMVKMSPKHGFALGTRLRTFGQFTNVSEDLAKLAFNVNQLDDVYAIPFLDTRSVVQLRLILK